MKLFNNKIFFTIIFIIFILFFLQFYFVSKSFKRDTNSYVTLLKGFGTLTTKTEKKVLKVDLKEKVSNGDVVNILDDSLAVVEWGDKSITRLGEKTKIIIKENNVNENLNKINISFELLKGKTWSNVISIFSGDSYFKQDIKGVSASVRGTVFEANYDNDYVIVHKHGLKVTNSSGEEKNISPGEVFSLKTFGIEKLKIVIDEAFQKLNSSMDEEYIKKLRENFINSAKESNPLNLVYKFSLENKIFNILSSGNSSKSKQSLEDYLETLSYEDKAKAIDYLNSLNQRVNFEDGKDPELYNLKLNIRKNLIKNSSDENYKKTLVQYSLYDLSDMISFDNYKQDIFDGTLGLLIKNKQYLDLQKENLKTLGRNSKIISQIFSIYENGLSKETIKEKLSEINESSKEVIFKGLDKILELYKKQNEK